MYSKNINNYLFSLSNSKLLLMVNKNDLELVEGANLIEVLTTRYNEQCVAVKLILQHMIWLVFKIDIYANKLSEDYIEDTIELNSLLYTELQKEINFTNKFIEERLPQLISKIKNNGIDINKSEQLKIGIKKALDTMLPNEEKILIHVNLIIETINN